MGVTCVRTGASTSNVYNILCACSADDAAEACSLYAPPSYCFADEVGPSGGGVLCFCSGD